MTAVKKYIPDFITSLNLVCGMAGLVFVFKDRFDFAFYSMLAAAVFDFFDGFAARALDSYSDSGRELDSLSDVVSFGVLPSFMLYSIMKACMFGESWVCWVPLLIAVFSALRLAKYNVSGYREDDFSGLPTPACAMLCGSLCCYICYEPSCFLAAWAAGPVFIPVLSVCLCALLVSRIRMFSMKFHRDDSKTVRTKRISFLVIILAAVVICLIFHLHFSFAVLLIFICYILKNVVYAIFGI